MSKIKSSFNRFAEIDSIVKNDDGTIVVNGYASSGSVDSDGEIITPEAMSAAIPDYMKFGAVREMHGKSAAGTALEAEVQADGRTFFSALVVDPIAIKKVETGTYKGFSIGGKVTGRDSVDKTIITGLNLIEVSLVDRPANPEALITMYKSDEASKTEESEVVAEVEAAAEVVKGEVVAAEAPAPADEIKKSMWAVGSFAELLARLGSLACDSAWEAEYEGDNSPVPGQMRDWLAQGAAILQAMAAEEVTEMMASLNAMIPAQTEVAVVELAEGVELAKAGAKFSASSKTALSEMHKAAQDMCDKFDQLGYKTDDDTVESSDNIGDIAKGLAASDEISKALEVANSELAKAQAANAELSETVTKAQARIAELEAQPEPAKAARFGLQVPISKGQDSSMLSDLPPEPPKGTEEHAVWAMKAIHKGDLAKV